MSSRQPPSCTGKSFSSLRVITKILIGKAFLRLLPGKAIALEKNLHRYRGTLFEKVLKAGLFGDAFLRRDDLRLMQYHRRHWLSPNVQEYYRRSNQRFRQYFLKHHMALIDALENYLLRNPSRFKHFVEIGCGAGLATAYMAQRFPWWEDCVGLDLSVSQTEENHRAHRDPRLRFVAADASEWIRREGKPDTVYLCNGGVLEYFSRRELEEILNHIVTGLKPSLFLCIEPIAPNHDLRKEPESRPHGTEMTFSHNYPFAFSQAGYKIEYRSEQFLDGVRWLLLLASAC